MFTFRSRRIITRLCKMRSSVPYMECKTIHIIENMHFLEDSILVYKTSTCINILLQSMVNSGASEVTNPVISHD